jgi:hypothetical protein
VQALIDRSMSRMGAHMREIFRSARRLSARQVAAYLEVGRRALELALAGR